MSKNFRLPMAFVFLAGLCFTIFGQDKTINPKDAKQLREIYQEFDRAGKTDDLTVIEKYLDESYELRDGDSTFSRAQIIERIKQFNQSVGRIDVLSSKIEKIRFADNSYFLEVISVMKGTLKAGNGATVPFESLTKSTDVWKKTENGWREILQIGRESKFFLNGKEILD